MAALPPPPIGEPESLGELTRVVNFSLVTISNTLTEMNSRLDHLVTAEKHRSDIESLQRDIQELRRKREEDRARTRATIQWFVGILVAVLAVAVPTIVALI